jgi:hypothetical protein
MPSGPSALGQVRIGIATGLVVVGDVIGEGVAQEPSVSHLHWPNRARHRITRR